jgi:ribonuclease BN (tRNA processing enzyme)
VRLTFLGTGAGNFKGSRRQPCGALLDSLLLDCGAGTTGRLHDFSAFDAVDAVLITHLHSDHVAGLFDLLLHTLITHRSRPLTVVSPPGLSPILRAIYAAQGTVAEPASLYPFTVVESTAPSLTVGRWRIEGIALDHSVVNLGYRVSTDGFSLFYTGDTREPSAALSVLAEFLLHEATYPDRQRALGREYGHSTSSQAADAARAMGARRLFLTHIGDLPDSDREIVAEAVARFADTTLAEDRSRFDL